MSVMVIEHRIEYTISGNKSDLSAVPLHGQRASADNLCAAFSRYFILSRSCFYICVSIEAYQELPGVIYYLIYLSYLQYLPTLAAAACVGGDPHSLAAGKDSLIP